MILDGTPTCRSFAAAASPLKGEEKEEKILDGTPTAFPPDGRKGCLPPQGGGGEGAGKKTVFPPFGWF